MKSEKLLHLLFFSIIFVGLHSCSLNGNDKETFVQVNEEFTIDMDELLGSPRQLIFDLQSVELEPCLNASINRTFIAQSDRLTLLINGIIPASDCNPGAAPAHGSSNVGFMPNGVYDFLVTVRNTVTNEGKLTINDHQYVINMLSSDGISISNSTLFRIPENTIWGYIAYNEANLVGNAPQAFLDELATLAQPKQLEQGYYGKFEINNNGELQLKNEPPFNHVLTFFYQFAGSDDQLKDLLENYRSGPSGTDIEMAIYTAKGKVL
jgi:hypothetical protein